MSRQHINAYRRTLAEQHRVTGSLNERVLRKAFADLLERTGRAHDLVFTNEWEGVGPRGNRIAVDGALVPPILRKPFGYWEAKDSKDDLDREIALKLAAGYPDDNIIYEDTRQAVLRQDGREAMRAPLDDDAKLLALLDRFFAHEPPELGEFKAASAKFRADLPQVIEALRHAVAEAEARSADFARARADFLAHARQAINPAVTDDDVREMLIQHILTEEIFASVFDNAQYHRENNVARRLGELEAKFFTGALRHATTELLRPYYGAIRHAASGLADRREKQTFLKKLYEDFYKVYNPAAADRLGVVYTPGEIVRFMVRGAEWLTERHFGKTLADPGVEILDPATGTGTFVVELIEHMQGAGTERLRAKYAEELHANEVAILPYYVANLNIEATFAAISGCYQEFPGLVLADTLNMPVQPVVAGEHFGDLVEGITEENFARRAEQLRRKISVVIGNPPYNANQRSENDNNQNLKYLRLDERLRKTYVRTSRATKTKTYDPYKRFFRWASDRIADKGIIAYISNRSYIDSKEGDGFRKAVIDEFDRVLIVDLGGDWKDKGRGGGSNVFDISTGVAICFLVRDGLVARTKRRIEYFRMDETDARSKLSWLGSTLPEDVPFGHIKPDTNGDWFDQDTMSRSLMPLAIKPVKGMPKIRNPECVFSTFGLGLSTNRDAWLVDANLNQLSTKVRLFVQLYDYQLSTGIINNSIKWSRNLKRKFTAKQREPVDPKIIRAVEYRPFTIRLLYISRLFVDELGRWNDQFACGDQPAMFFSNGKRTDFAVLAGSRPANLDMFLPNSTTIVTRHRYLKSGERVDNITDWALDRFRTQYPEDAITKDDIFAYCYAVLHDPVYRDVHAADLRREFPRVPLYPGFARWRDWGLALLALHIAYETVTPFALTRVDTPDAKGRAAVPKLRSLPDQGIVVVDSQTQITGIPAAAWRYRLGNRSAIDWVLDQHKEKTPRDPTVADKFNTYRLADHKDAMIALLAKVVRVSVDTVAITDAMAALERGGRGSRG